MFYVIKDGHTHKHKHFLFFFFNDVPSSHYLFGVERRNLELAPLLNPNDRVSRKQPISGLNLKKFTKIFSDEIELGISLEQT